MPTIWRIIGGDLLIEHWRYLFASPSTYFMSYSKNRRIEWLRWWFIAIKCRADYHPNGQIYYNPNGLSPNEHCKDCGDEI